MTDANKSKLKIGGLCLVVVGTGTAIAAGGDVSSVSGLVTLVGAAVSAISAVLIAVFGGGNSSS